MIIKEIKKDDVSLVVELHLKSFDGFFLSRLGEDFLRIFYEKLRTNDRSMLIGAYEKSVLVGFCAFTTHSAGYYSNLIRKNIFVFSIIGFKLLLTKPDSLIRILKNLKKESNTIDDKGDYAELLSIAILPSMQGAGIGKKLLLKMENELLKRECKSVSLTTDSDQNVKAINVYKSMGYEIYYDFIAFPKRKMYRMIKSFQV